VDRKFNWAANTAALWGSVMRFSIGDRRRRSFAMGMLPTCPVCNERVELETSKTDEMGQAIHEECYLELLHKKEARSALLPNKTFRAGGSS